MDKAFTFLSERHVCPPRLRFEIPNKHCFIFFFLHFASLIALPQDKKLKFNLNGNRKVMGTLRGYDAFLNVVLEEAQVVDSDESLGTIVVRGNSIIHFEGVDRLAAANASAAASASSNQ